MPEILAMLHSVQESSELFIWVVLRHIGIHAGSWLDVKLKTTRNGYCQWPFGSGEKNIFIASPIANPKS